MPKRKHYAHFWDTVACKLPLTEKEQFYELCTDMERTPSDVLHALIHMFLSDPVNVAIHLEKHFKKIDEEKEEKKRRMKLKRPEELKYKRYISPEDVYKKE